MSNKYSQLYCLSLLQITKMDPTLGLKIGKAWGVSADTTCSGLLINMSELKIEDPATFSYIADNKIPVARRAELAPKRELFESLIGKSLERLRCKYQAIP